MKLPWLDKIIRIKESKSQSDAMHNFCLNLLQIKQILYQVTNQIGDSGRWDTAMKVNKRSLVDNWIALKNHLIIFKLPIDNLTALKCYLIIFKLPVT